MPTLKLLEEVACQSGSSVNEQAAHMIRTSILLLYPPKTDDQWLEEVKEVQLDILLLRRQFFHELRQKQSDKGEEIKSSATPSLEEAMRGEGEPSITVTLSGGRIERLQEISHERGTSVPEETARLIQYFMDERYRPMTDEEREQEVKQVLQEMDVMWKDIIGDVDKDNN